MYDFIHRIHKINPARSRKNLARRVIKLSEETGETAEAYLYVTTENSKKDMTWDDIREEALDTAIVGLDIALTRFPTDKDRSSEEIEQEVIDVIERKLAKWQRQLDSGQDATQREKSIDNDE